MSLLTSIITRLPSIKPTTRLTLCVCACGHLIYIVDKKCPDSVFIECTFLKCTTPLCALSEKCVRIQKQHHFNSAFFLNHCIKTGKWKMSQPTTPLKCTRKKMSLALRKTDESPRRARQSASESERAREKEKKKKKRTVTNGLATPCTIMQSEYITQWLLPNHICF